MSVMEDELGLMNHATSLSRNKDDLRGFLDRYPLDRRSFLVQLSRVWIQPSAVAPQEVAQRSSGVYRYLRFCQPILLMTVTAAIRWPFSGSGRLVRIAMVTVPVFLSFSHLSQALKTLSFSAVGFLIF